MQAIGIYAVPTLLLIIIGFGLLKKENVFEAFTDGAKEGLCCVFRIFPSLLGLICSISMLKASGFFDFLLQFIRPAMNFLKIPSELVPLMLMRPISGSGAMAVITDIFKTHSPDSFIGLCASVMMGSTETTFYTIAIYYGSVGITKIRHTAKAALVADLIGMIGSVLAVRFILR